MRGRRLFQLDLGPVALAFAGMSSPDDQRFLDELLAGATPAEYAGRLLAHRGIDWAVQRLAEIRERGPGLLSS